MIDLTQGKGFRNLVNGIHASLGANFVWGFMVLKWGMWHGVETCLVYGILKEGIFDPIFETPETSGGWVGGVKDFLGYVVGTAIAVGVVYLKRRFHHV